MQNLPFGAYLRQLRVAKNMPLRKLAAALDIDTSTLSKIERQERSANAAMMPVIAKFFSLDLKELQIRFWTEKLIAELKDEAYIIEALENTLAHLKAAE